MARDFAVAFYHSQAWKKCQASYTKQAHGLCEVCKSKGLIVPGVIVHHKIHLTPENISDPDITLNPGNLMLVCRDCHADIHRERTRRYTADDMGRIIATE